MDSKMPQVGDIVYIKWGRNITDATVIEDRGYIGKNARHLIRIRTTDEHNSIDIEVPLEELIQPNQE